MSPRGICGLRGLPTRGTCSSPPRAGDSSTAPQQGSGVPPRGEPYRARPVGVPADKNGEAQDGGQVLERQVLQPHLPPRDQEGPGRAEGFPLLSFFLTNLNEHVSFNCDRSQDSRARALENETKACFGRFFPVLGRECHVSGPRTETLRLPVAQGGRREGAASLLKNNKPALHLSSEKAPRIRRLSGKPNSDKGGESPQRLNIKLCASDSDIMFRETFQTAHGKVSRFETPEHVTPRHQTRLEVCICAARARPRGLPQFREAARAAEGESGLGRSAPPAAF